MPLLLLGWIMRLLYALLLGVSLMIDSLFVNELANLLKSNLPLKVCDLSLLALVSDASTLASLLLWD
jgi:hypothetical protein